jgi:hypothetical protein
MEKAAAAAAAAAEPAAAEPAVAGVKVKFTGLTQTLGQL